MKKERSFDIFEISGKTAIGLLVTAAAVPFLAVPALFLTPVAACIWLLGQCAEYPSQPKKQTSK